MKPVPRQARVPRLRDGPRARNRIRRIVRGEADHRHRHGEHLQNRHRIFGIRPRARRWHRAGIGHADRRRAGHRQIDIAAGNRRQCGEADGVRHRAQYRTVYFRRGIAGAGPHRARAHRRHGAESTTRLHHGSVHGVGAYRTVQPALAIVDSAQTIVSQDVDGISGGSTQVREVASALIDTAKTLDIPVLLVGHVTKDGSIAGPRTLEHLVDVVCQFEGDAETALRMLRAVKNRFGPTDEVGLVSI